MRWILDHMASSSKMEHVAFITYVRRSAEEAEQVEAALLLTEGSDEGTGTMTKAAPKGYSRPPHHEGHVWETSWDVVSEQGHPDSALQEQVSLLGERISQMELMMQQMVQHLSQSSHPSQSSQAA